MCTFHSLPFETKFTHLLVPLTSHLQLKTERSELELSSVRLSSYLSSPLIYSLFFRLTNTSYLWLPQ